MDNATPNLAYMFPKNILKVSQKAYFLRLFREKEPYLVVFRLLLFLKNYFAFQVFLLIWSFIFQIFFLILCCSFWSTCCYSNFFWLYWSYSIFMFPVTFAFFFPLSFVFKWMLFDFENSSIFYFVCFLIFFGLSFTRKEFCLY